MSYQQKLLFQKQCVYCKKEFHPKNLNQKYCDSTCVLKAQKARYQETNWDNSPRKCLICGKEFVPKNLKQKYCSNTCSLKSTKANYQKTNWDNSPRKCLICGKEFVPKHPSIKYCDRTCAKEAGLKQQIQQKTNWDNSPKKCLICGKEFVPQHPNNCYCSTVCAKEGYHSNVQKLGKNLNYTPRHEDEKQRKCLICGKELVLKQATRKYCSPECRKEQTRRNSKRMLPEIIKRKPIYTNFNGLLFWKEEEFEKWFRNNFVLFGLRSLQKIDRLFPDVIAETYNGKLLRIELELCASNFIAHGHDPLMCDLIISFVKSSNTVAIRGVPVISIFNAKGLNKGLADYEPESLELTDYFQRIVVFLNNSLSEVFNNSKH